MEICTEDGVTLVVEVVEDLGVGVDGLVNGLEFGCPLLLKVEGWEGDFASKLLTS